MTIRCRRQITHGRFQRLVPHPVLDSSYVETPPEHARGIRGSEGLQIEFFGIEAGAFSDQFAASQEMCKQAAIILPASSGSVPSGGRCSVCRCGDAASRNTEGCLHALEEKPQPP